MARSRAQFFLASALVSAVIAGLAAVVLFCFDPSQFPIYPVCLFHRSTGLLCPGCGSLRALHQLLHGHFAAAFHFNPLLISSLPLVAWLTVRFAIRKAKRQPATLNVKPVWLWSALTLLLVFGVLRNLSFPQLAWLAL